jgi:hypothetical protein
VLRKVELDLATSYPWVINNLWEVIAILEFESGRSKHLSSREFINNSRLYFYLEKTILWDK